MSKREWTLVELARAADVLWPDGNRVCPSLEVAKRALDAGMTVPPDPVRSRLVDSLRRVWLIEDATGDALCERQADRIIRDFDITPRDPKSVQP